MARCVSKCDWKSTGEVKDKKEKHKCLGCGSELWFDYKPLPPKKKDK